MVKLLLAEYQIALGPVRQLLATARGMIHLTFDGWTSRKFSSFIGIHAHLIDAN